MNSPTARLKTSAGPRGRGSPSALRGWDAPKSGGRRGQRKGSGCGRVDRLFDQLHEACRVMREAAHVARGGEPDGR